MASIKEEQVATRRRALGRRILQKASGVQVVGVEGIRDSSDLQFLDAKEKKALEGYISHLEQVVERLARLGNRLDQ